MLNFSEGDIDAIRISGFFDEKWYRTQYPDVDMLGIDPIEHYLRIGWRLQRDPSAKFSTRSYLSLHEDVDRSGQNPLLHYVKHGEQEGRILYIEGNAPNNNSHPAILLCAHEANQHFFGGERSFIDIATALNTLEVNIYITLPQLNNSEYLEVIKGLSAGVYSFPYPIWDKRLNVDTDALRKFMRIIRQRDISIVYANTIMLREPQLAALRMEKVSFCHARELILEDEYLRARIGKPGDAIVTDVLNRSTKVIANSQATARMFAAKPDKVICAPNVVDTALLDIPNTITDQITFGLISSNIPKKGLSDLVQIARRCEEEVPGARFLAIGPIGPYVKELMSAGLPTNLRFTGYAENPLEAVRQLNVVLSLSHFAESFGRTVAEGLAARRPVIAYKRGALPELVTDGKSGFLAAPGSIDDVVTFIATMVKNPDRLLEMGEFGRSEMIRRYSPLTLKTALGKAISTAIFQKRPSVERIRLTTYNPKKITVIVPIFNAFEDVRECLISLAKHTSQDGIRILMLDDASPDPRIKPLLEQFSKSNGFFHIQSKQNLGYTASANIGLKWAGDDDVVLLNSDTITSPGWLVGLTDIAKLSSSIGTVTAMSDNAGAFSFPIAHVRNDKPSAVSHELWTWRIVENTKHCAPVEVPTGNGFCMFIKRAVIDEIGPFDAEAFPRGYGEENDFCMRAMAAGFTNVISPRSYVFHERSKSFGASKAAHSSAGESVIERKFPSYKAQVKKAFASKDMLKLREAAATAFEAPRLSALKNLDEKADEGVRLSALNEALIDWDFHSHTKRDPSITSIVICMLNKLKITLACLDSIAKSTRNFEVILVDNGSEPDVARELKIRVRDYPFVRVLHTYENLNFALGNNLGFSVSRGENIVFLNNDTEVKERWLEPLVSCLENPEVKGVQPKLIYPDGSLQCVGIVFSKHGQLGYPIYARQKDAVEYAGRKRLFKAITGACFAVRASDFANARGFDPIFLNGQEDVDLCLRIGRGAPVFAYVPSSVVLHHESKTPGRGKHVLQNRRNFLQRWKWMTRADDFLYYNEDGMMPLEFFPDSEDLVSSNLAFWAPRRVARVAEPT